MLHPLKITSTLADETRFQIYDFMLQNKRTFTVQEIANQFQIHPNVARLHLTKLSEIKVVTADFVKTGKGGRPGRLYKAAEEGITLTFPKREEPLLFNILLQLVSSLGEEAVDKGKELAYIQGLEEMKGICSRAKSSLTFEEKVNLLSERAALIGYVPLIAEQDAQRIIQFTIYNCPFHNQLPLYQDLICTFHEAYLRGQIDALFSQNEFIQTENMLHKCEHCKYEIHVK
ncbi:helix-turn-helix transcriptional regulator [Lysinibacillus sp. LZ02]|uniref:helix-turn-helix transcriptional regulator n=1 Tax=Lysinibacillus sp. LZ02 TaxID=3420668 RepID=UPI003D366033